jgi:hypothetical protein
MYVHYNGNPCGKTTGDCVVRAIEIATGKTWYQVYAGLCVQGRFACDWGNVNDIWPDYLLYLGFERHGLPFDPTYTAADFAADHPRGTYILGTGDHAVAVVDGCIVDSWDSSGVIPKYYFCRGDF